jgi:FUS-interacting serine-arginine-rich protein 1
VQFLNPFDAAEAKRYMDRRMFNGREITVVFAEENRKRPEEMRIKERGRYVRM